MSESTLVEVTPTVSSDSPHAAPVADDALYEVIDGRIVETPAMGFDEALIATTLAAWIYHSGGGKRIGRVVTEALFKLDPSRDLKRRPDVAFISYERWPRGGHRLIGEALDVVPDLAVEVVSPTNTATEIFGKVEDYFRAGVRLVWLILPDQTKVYAYTSPTAVGILQPGDDLDGGPVIPGFRMPVKSLFEEED